MEITKNLLYCVGLWLAEGDSKTDKELTFTNNSLELIFFFQETINKIYTGTNLPRLYVYSANGIKYFETLSGFKKINYYIDNRANRPYYIYRLADTSFVKIWKKLVQETIKEENYIDLLKGIFAGEGNIKHDIKNHNSRNVRISSKEPNELIEKAFRKMEIPINFNQEQRNYWIFGRQLNKLDENNICILHPEKSHKFKKMIESRRECHYSPFELKAMIYNLLIEPKTTKELSKRVNRTETRILEVLQELKKENKIGYIKIPGNTHWMHKELKNKIILNRKKIILEALEKNKSYTKIGKATNIYRKTIKKDLEKLKTEGFVEYSNKEWKMTEKGQNLILGIDEAGKLIKGI